MDIKFVMTDAFDEFYRGLSPSNKEIANKVIKKIKNKIEYDVYKTEKFLQYDFAGTRRERVGRFRIFFRICKECRSYGHDSKYGRCRKCLRQDNLVWLILGDECRDEYTYKDKEMLEKNNSLSKENPTEFKEA